MSPFVHSWTSVATQTAFDELLFRHSPFVLMRYLLGVALLTDCSPPHRFRFLSSDCSPTACLFLLPLSSSVLLPSLCTAVSTIESSLSSGSVYAVLVECLYGLPG